MKKNKFYSNMMELKQFQQLLMFPMSFTNWTMAEDDSIFLELNILFLQCKPHYIHLYSKCTDFVRLILRQFPMATTRDHLFAFLKPKWNWAKIDSQLFTKSQAKTITVSLAPTITFENLQEQGPNSKLKITLSIDIQKSLQFDSSIGWNWHKSSNLPVISLKADSQDFQHSDQKYRLPESLEARIFAVKIVVNPLERQKVSHLEDVGLRGADRVQINDGIGIFNGIRFKTTSYINEGVKFHLLVILYVKDGKENPEFRNIVSSVISPAIFVDSRKSARDHFQKRFISFAHVFHPDLLQREFLKKSVKDKTCESEVRVENSMDGMYNYLTAPNIRHKVKHPLFLCVKFSNVFQILFNTELEEFQNNNQPKMENIIYRLQKILLSEIGRKRKAERNGFEMEKPFLMGVMGQCSSSKKAKIYECLEFLNCNSIELIKYNYQIGPHFQNIFDAGDMVEVYRSTYQLLKETSSKDQDFKDQIEDNSDLKEEQGKAIKDEERDSEGDGWKETKRMVSPSENVRQLMESKNKVKHASYQQNLPTNLSPRLDLGLLNHYSSIIQQIELQNSLLGNIIRENTTIKQKLLAYCKSMTDDISYTHTFEPCYSQLSYFPNLAIHMPVEDFDQTNKNTLTRVKRQE